MVRGGRSGPHPLWREEVTAGVLLERDRECGVLHAVARRLADGQPGVVTVVGEPGTGRSALLAHVVEEAARLGVAVAVARGRRWEADIRWGAAAQLREALSARLPGWSRLDRLDGADHVLVDLCAGVLAAARDRPLLLVVDDVHWLDPDSATLLEMLLRRIRQAPLAFVLSAVGDRPTLVEEPTPPADLLTPLTTPRLSDVAVARLCHERLGTRSDGPVTRAVVANGHGLPGLIVPALAEFAADTADRASAERIAAILARRRVAQVDELVDGLPADCLALLRVLAVAGDDLDPRSTRGVPGLADVRPDTPERLRATGLVGGHDRLRPAAQVADRVLAAMGPVERSALHVAVATAAHRLACPDDVVGRVLLGAPPVGARWASDALHRAARRALRAGRQEFGVALLDRALAEPLRPDDRSLLTVELACAQVRDRPHAADRNLAAAVLRGGAHRAEAVELLLARGALDTVHRVVAHAVAEDPTEHQALRALRRLAGLSGADGTRWDEPDPHAGDDAVAGGVEAWRLAVVGTDPVRTRDTALTALGGPPELALHRLLGAAALVLADEPDLARPVFEDVLDDASRRGVRVTAAFAALGLAATAYRCGALEQSAAHLDRALAELPLPSWAPRMRGYPLALRALVELARGCHDSAERAVAGDLPAEVEGGFGWTGLLHARAAVLVASGEPERALRDLEECGRRLAGRGWHNPALIAWRPLAVEALTMIGDREGVATLLGEEFRAVTGWSTRSCVGTAWLLSARTGGPESGLRSLRRAERELRESPARLAHAQAQADLAAALPGGSGEGEWLRATALRTARECGARPLARRIEAMPARRRHPRSDDVLAGLSPAQTRAVRLVAEGLSNPRIAQALGVARRTVEMHLTTAYRKLGVAGRAELVALLGAGEGL
ncbi:AAA family ATPase [Actinosynnema sp. NPDC020468]|uniref:AAA family ATPase n=1 Tax=Actinosynnema sp. NPDC020468 TaxID=3154488 RepID=UPI0033CD8F49